MHIAFLGMSLLKSVFQALKVPNVAGTVGAKSVAGCFCRLDATSSCRTIGS